MQGLRDRLVPSNASLVKIIRSLLLNERKDVTIPLRNLTQQVIASHRNSPERDVGPAVEAIQDDNIANQEKIETASSLSTTDVIQPRITKEDDTKQTHLSTEGAIEDGIDCSINIKKKARRDSESSDSSSASSSSNKSSSSGTSSSDDRSDDSSSTSSSSSSMSEMES